MSSSFLVNRSLKGSWQNASLSSVHPPCPLWLKGKIMIAQAFGFQHVQITTESTEKARRAQRMFIYLLFPFFLIGCGHDHSEENGHDHQKEEEGHNKEKHEPPKNRVLLTKPQMKNAKIETAPPQRMDLAKSIHATGKLELPPDNKAGVSPTIGGNVADVKIIQGAKVDRGDVLAILEHPDIIQLQQDYLESREELKYLRQELERTGSLYADSVGSTRALQQARSEHQRMKARVNAQGAKLRSIGVDTATLEDESDFRQQIPLRSPIHGVVSEVNVKIGSYASPDEELFEVLDIHHMHIDLMVYEKDLHKVKVGQHVLFDLVGREVPRPMKAEVFGIGNSIDKERKAAKVHAEIEDSLVTLFPGIYVEALIDVDSAKNARVVPQEAVLRYQDEHHLFLDRGKNDHGERSFERIPVRKGIDERGYVEVEGLENPLPKDGKVVVRGAPYLLRHMRKGVGGHSH